MGLFAKCDNCSKKKDVKKLAGEQFCKNCFEDKLGKIILETDSGKYLGGHAHYSKKSGSLYLTQNSFIFVGGRGSQRWKIQIPLTSIDLDEWDYHKFVIPYLDEKGTKQSPEFKIKQKVSKSGYLEWTHEINELVSKLPAEKPKQNQTAEPNEINKLYQDLKDGKITMDEYASSVGIAKSEQPIELETEQPVEVETEQTQQGEKFCKRCGNGIDLGNQCKVCKGSPFCEMCSERSPSMGNVCNDCKKSHDLMCRECGKLCEYQCVSCKNLKKKGKIDHVIQCCEEHFQKIFVGKSKKDYFYCTNCGGQVCSVCAIKKRMRKKRTCENCEHELIVKVR